MMPKAKPKTVDEYIAASPEGAKEKLSEMRALLRKVAPNATEALKWGQPVFEEGRILFSYSAFRSHMTFMPTRSTIDHFKNELANYKTGRDTIQLPYDRPLPKALIRKIATHRLKEVTEEGALWMHRRPRPPRSRQ